jgi:hypothetical protein
MQWPSFFAQAVEVEVADARRKHNRINSVHEGYAVILEELDEFWEQVRKRSEQRDQAEMWMELVQVAAMAQRTAEDCVKSVPDVQGGTNAGPQETPTDDEHNNDAAYWAASQIVATRSGDEEREMFASAQLRRLGYRLEPWKQ